MWRGTFWEPNYWLKGSGFPRRVSSPDVVGGAGIAVLILVLSGASSLVVPVLQDRSLGNSSSAPRFTPSPQEHPSDGAKLLQEAEASLSTNTSRTGVVTSSCEVDLRAAGCPAPQAPNPSDSPATPLTSPPAPNLPHSRAPSARYGASISLFLNGTPGLSPPLTWGVLLFGGANSSGNVFNDTWQFNATSVTWWNVTPYLHCTSSTCPSPRHGATATWDYRDNYSIMFGGCTVASPGWTESVPGCDSSAGHLLSETWNYSDPHGGVGHWTQQHPSTHPSARFSEGLSSNNSSSTGIARNTAVYLFGGCGTTCPLGDTWKYAAGTWTNLSIAGPAARYGMSMAWSDGNATTTPAYGAGGPVVLFGGCTTNAPGCEVGGISDAANDTWLLYGGAWHEAIASSYCSAVVLCPSVRYDMAQTSYQGPSGPWQLIIYGGVGPGGVILGNATEANGGWWAFYANSPVAPAIWVELGSPPGYTSGLTGNSTLYNRAWYGPSPIGPPPPGMMGCLKATGWTVQFCSEALPRRAHPSETPGFPPPSAPSIIATSFGHHQSPRPSSVVQWCLITMMASTFLSEDAAITARMQRYGTSLRIPG